MVLNINDVIKLLINIRQTFIILAIVLIDHVIRSILRPRSLFVMISELIVIVEFKIVLTLVKLLIRSFISTEVRSNHNVVLESNGSVKVFGEDRELAHKLKSVGMFGSHHLEMKGDSILLMVKRNDRLKIELIEPVNFKNEFLLSMVKATRVVIIPNLERVWVVPFLENVLGKDSSKEDLGIAINPSVVKFGLVNRKVANFVFDSFVTKSRIINYLDGRIKKLVRMRAHRPFSMHKHIGREKVPEKVAEHQKIMFGEPRVRKLVKEPDVFLKLVGNTLVLHGRSHGPHAIEVVLDDVEQIVVETILLFQATRFLEIISILRRIRTAIIAGSKMGLRNMETIEADTKALAVKVIEAGVLEDGVNIAGGYRNLVNGESFLGDIFEEARKILFFSDILVSLLILVDSSRNPVRLIGIEFHNSGMELWFNNLM